MADVGLRKQQAAQTEAELKAAAVRVFERSGFLNAKITDITSEAGRATGSFYKHFTGKESLLEALLTDVLASGDAAVRTAGDGHLDDFRDIEAIRWHVQVFVDAYHQHHTVLRALQQAATVDDTFARRQRELLAPDLQHIADHLGDLDERHDPLAVASLITGLMWTFAETWSGPGSHGRGTASDQDMIDTMTSFIHAGLDGLRRQT